ncbi:uncharacterized protein Triagg1_10153 [Trichoderma aggressivum f. europaeum]|uniref:Uncharacterized protein n=1 Tax=Trichoderma aggressivum f. europaeum TaxID=173218 RepID=A0AAE1I619_9HYPO|nr:hypothetical protein Triagg1_10153 [Trichoderma aggressivum f. europaeum]
MAKRKSDAEAPLAPKRVKLQQPATHDAVHDAVHNGQIPDIHARHSPDSAPPSTASPEGQPRQKRKRTLDSQSDSQSNSQSDPQPDSPSDDDIEHLEEPGAKRARISSSPESPDPSLEPWPSVGYDPREVELSWWEQLFIRSHRAAMLLHEQYDSDIDTSADDQNPLPSPEPSDQDVNESQEWEFPTVHSTNEPQSTAQTSRLLSRQRRRQRDATPPPQRKRRQPPKTDKDGENKRNKRNKTQREAPSPAVEAFLQTKRSSRRDPNCKLWQLGDDGTACTVSRVR